MSNQLTAEQEEEIAMKYFSPMCFTKDEAVSRLKDFVKEYGSNLFPAAALEREKVKGVASAEEVIRGKYVTSAFPSTAPVFTVKETIDLMETHAAQFQPKWLPIDQMPKDDHMLKVQRWHILWGCPVTVSYRPDDDRPQFPWVDGTCTSTWPEQSFTPHFAYCLPSPPTPTP